MILSGISHAPLSKDAYMVAEDSLVVSIKAAKGDLAKVDLYFGDRVCQKDPIDVFKVEMELVASDMVNDYFECEIKTDYTRVCYYFELTDFAGEKLFYDEYGFSQRISTNRTQYFQFPYLRKEDMISIPEWVNGIVMYHIFPDSFADGKRSISCEEKNIQEGDIQYHSNLGGTIKGIEENLDYIASLGANCIYINPIFKANSYHKYDTVDYMDIDPCFGTIEDFKELVKACHSKDIKVILDGVFNHCGPDFFAFKDVLKNGEKSKYVDWFYKLRFPIETKPIPNYEAFAYVAAMPKLNTGNPEVEKYCCDVGRFWIRECGIDGWRMDVANEINHDFFRAFRKAIKEENPESFLIGEIWEDSTIWLQGDQFDSTMNYTFTNICKDFFGTEEISVSTFDARIHKMNRRYPRQVALAQMNFLDTHDVQRFKSACNSDEEKLKLALAYMVCAVGIPSVFYGDEKGIEGTTEPEYRSPMAWDKQTELEDYYRQLLRVRRSTKALQKGNYKTVLCDDEKKLYMFSRTYEDETALIIFNMGNNAEEVSIPNYLNQGWINALSGKEEAEKQIGVEGRTALILIKKGD